MTDKKTFKVPFRRRKEGKTDYKKRLALVKSRQNRLVVRKSNRQIVAAITAYSQNGDKTLVFAASKELRKFGWKGNAANLSAGYLLGLIIGRKTLINGQKKVILDIGLHAPHHSGVIFAVAKGARDTGLQINVGENAFPSNERIQGKHTNSFVEKLSPQELQKQFSRYLKNGFDPKKTVEAFEQTKKAILETPENELKPKQKKG